MLRIGSCVVTRFRKLLGCDEAILAAKKYKKRQKMLLRHCIAAMLASPRIGEYSKLAPRSRKQIGDSSRWGD